MSFRMLQTDVLNWATDKDLLHVENAPKQFMKFIEEVFEFKTELDTFNEIKSDSEFSNGYQKYIEHNLKLEMGDIFVTLIILCEQIGIDPEECLSMAYEKISKRKGKTIGGQFIKEEDLIDE